MACLQKSLRVVLPPATDVIRDAMLAAPMQVATRISRFLVLDFVDAFWTIPLRMMERLFFTGKIGQIVLVDIRTAQRSRAGSVSWAHASSLAMRCSQSISRD